MVPAHAKHDGVVQTLNALPSLYMIYAWFESIPIEKWAAFAGFLFILAQLIGYLWRLRRDMRIERERQSSRPPDASSGDTV